MIKNCLIEIPGMFLKILNNIKTRLKNSWICGTKRRTEMNNEHPLLSDFLEELKVQYNGSNLNKHISIFYNDWSLNPDGEDDYSERVGIAGDVLKNINSKEFQNYEVLWYDQSIFNPNFIEIRVKEIK